MFPPNGIAKEFQDLSVRYVAANPSADWFLLHAASY